MPRADVRRLRLPGATYFFTAVTGQRRPLLVDHIGLLRRAFVLTINRHPFDLQAIVVLPDHLHTMWTLPGGDSDFSTRWMVLKRLFSAGLAPSPSGRSQQVKREKGIWQRRYYEHCIRDGDDWRRHLDYIHYNPVKHGYCSRASEWPHSSFARTVRRGLYTADWGSVAPSTAMELDVE